MKILVAPDSFKGSLSASQFCTLAEQAIRQLDQTIQVDCLPLADGGEGTLEALCRTRPLICEKVEVTGPMGQLVEARLGFSPDRKTCVFDMASASGLTLVPELERDPLRASSYGTGQLLVHALDSGVDRILMGIGGSATNDGGAGMLQALGFRLLDPVGMDIPRGAEGLGLLRNIDVSSVHPRLGDVAITVACDVVNPLLGPKGATQIYGPQKGANEAMLPILEQGIKCFADTVETFTGRSFREVSGAGAAGGLGFSLVSLLGAELRRGFDLIAESIGLRERLLREHYDWIFTGEGRIDSQSHQGKFLSQMGQMALDTQTPLVAFTGALSLSSDQDPPPGILHIFPILSQPCSLDEAIEHVETLLFATITRVLRLILACSKG